VLLQRLEPVANPKSQQIRVNVFEFRPLEQLVTDLVSGEGLIGFCAAEQLMIEGLPPVSG